MNLVAICGVALVIEFGLGMLFGFVWKDSKEEKRMSARVIRPAEIKIEKHYHIVEYTVSNEALDIDFPTVEKIR